MSTSAHYATATLVVILSLVAVALVLADEPSCPTSEQQQIRDLQARVESLEKKLVQQNRSAAFERMRENARYYSPAPLQPRFIYPPVVYPQVWYLPPVYTYRPYYRHYHHH